MSGQGDSEIDLAYELDEKPPVSEAIPLGIQHVLVMIVPSTAVAFLVAGEVGLGAADTGYLVQMVLLFSGLATIVQAYTIGPVGAKLPIVMGTSFTFLGAASAIGSQQGLAAVFGAVLVTGIVVEGLIGWQFGRIESFFPPLVTGLIVIIIGLYLIPTGMEYAGGGDPAATSFGSVQNLGLAALVLLIAVLFNLFLDGVARILSVFIGIVVGYAVAIAFGVVDFSPIANASLVEVPMPGEFGYAFDPVAIVTFAFLFLVSAMETVGDMSGITAAEGRNPDQEEFRGGIFADGLMSSIGAVFGSFPVTSFSQNVGIVNFTGIMSRHVVGVSGIFLTIMGLSPIAGAVVTTIPEPVFGGAVLVMVGMVAASGMRLLFLNVEMNRRNMVIISTSLGLGLGVAVVPEALQGLPRAARTFFGEAVIMTGLSALLLNTFVPGDSSPLFDDPAEPADRADESAAVSDD
ncbi:uracil permease [Halostagnicola larsenii XH-48]|uniref:Uracil permease n=1 Tax=Halostagnicola larsenii XH-48 TaxID=797299 RepID=W0JQH6_9EURY|nr:nucleobase:cation symporter-2 family protein [Halostagnicola larsenii]AHF99419.1 uracil permease [Halostagnicola larsenii XH-48]